MLSPARAILNPGGCITEFLRQLIQCPRDQVSALARSLAEHGRAILPECLEAARQAGPQTRQRLRQAWLPEPEAEATLLTMDHPRLAERRPTPTGLATAARNDDGGPARGARAAGGSLPVPSLGDEKE